MTAPFDPADREQIAHLLLNNYALIRRRVLAEMRARGAFRASGGGYPDPEDVSSSAIRRIDRALHLNMFKGTTEPEFWAFVLAITSNLVCTVMRDQLVRVRAEHKVPARHTPDNDECARVAVELHRLVMSARTESDRELIHFKLIGLENAEIAAATGRTPEAVRTQWCRVRRHARANPPPPPPRALA